MSTSQFFFPSVFPQIGNLNTQESNICDSVFNVQLFLRMRVKQFDFEINSLFYITQQKFSCEMPFFSRNINEVLCCILVSWELVTVRFKVKLSVGEPYLCTEALSFLSINFLYSPNSVMVVLVLESLSESHAINQGKLMESCALYREQKL